MSAGDTNPTLDSIIADYLRAAESGDAPDHKELIDEHPELADDLGSFFANHEEMNHAASADEETLPPAQPVEDKTLPAAGAKPVDETMAAQSVPAEDATLPTIGTEECLALVSRHSAGADVSAMENKLKNFGDYELLEEIARGGMGVVYKARQPKLNRIVALKMILAGQLAGEEDVARFHAEAEAAANLDHPGIVPVYEVGEHEGQHFFSMGFVEGESLADRIKDGPLPPREAAEYTKKIAQAIAFAHERGVIHRDLKPANVLLDQKDQPKVTDFGLAKIVEGDSGLTATGQILGTPSYMPPEQAAGQLDRVNEAADIYSLGAMLYTLITGRPPFQADSHLDTLMQILEQDPAPPRLLNPKVDRDLETICLKCLEKDPARRYASAGTLSADLDRFTEGEAISVKSLNLLDRVARSLQRSKYDVELRSWGNMLYWFAAIVLLAEIGIYLLALGGPPIPRHWALLIRTMQAAAMGLVLWSYRETWSVSTGSAERQMLSLWLGFLISCNLVLAVAYLLSTPERPLDELGIYPYFAVISGLTYFVMGSSYWGQCYAFAIAFFVLALVMPLKLLWGPLEFGILWGLCLVLIARRLRSLSSSG